MNLAALREPFPATEIEWRLGQAGMKGDKVWAKVLAYVTNRAIMDRLDSVCGPENWKNEFRYEQNGAVLCGLSIRVPISQDASEWVTKWDGAENTDIEAVKGGLSNAMKRAAVQFGIGRYLYDLEEGWAEISESGMHYAPAAAKKDGSQKYPAFKWNPPKLPAWALPTVDGEHPKKAREVGASRGDATPSGERGNVHPASAPSGGSEKPKVVKLAKSFRDELYQAVGGDMQAVWGLVTQATKKPCPDDDHWPMISQEQYENIKRAIAFMHEPEAIADEDEVTRLVSVLEAKLKDNSIPSKLRVDAQALYHKHLADLTPLVVLQVIRVMEPGYQELSG